MALVHNCMKVGYIIGYLYTFCSPINYEFTIDLNWHVFWHTHKGNMQSSHANMESTLHFSIITLYNIRKRVLISMRIRMLVLSICSCRYLYFFFIRLHLTLLACIFLVKCRLIVDWWERVRSRQQMQLLERRRALKSWRARQMLISPADRLRKHRITMCSPGNYERNSFSKYDFSSNSLTEKYTKIMNNINASFHSSFTAND